MWMTLPFWQVRHVRTGIREFLWIFSSEAQALVSFPLQSHTRGSSYHFWQLCLPLDLPSFSRFPFISSSFFSFASFSLSFLHTRFSPFPLKSFDQMAHLRPSGLRIDYTRSTCVRSIRDKLLIFQIKTRNPASLTRLCICIFLSTD